MKNSLIIFLCSLVVLIFNFPQACALFGVSSIYLYWGALFVIGGLSLKSLAGKQ